MARTHHPVYFARQPDVVQIVMHMHNKASIRPAATIRTSDAGVWCMATPAARRTHGKRRWIDRARAGISSPGFAGSCWCHHSAPFRRKIDRPAWGHVHEEPTWRGSCTPHAAAAK